METKKESFPIISTHFGFPDGEEGQIVSEQSNRLFDTQISESNFFNHVIDKIGEQEDGDEILGFNVSSYKKRLATLADPFIENSSGLIESPSTVPEIYSDQIIFKHSVTELLSEITAPVQGSMYFPWLKATSLKDNFQYSGYSSYSSQTIAWNTPLRDISLFEDYLNINLEGIFESKKDNTFEFYYESLKPFKSSPYFTEEVLLYMNSSYVDCSHYSRVLYWWFQKYLKNQRQRIIEIIINEAHKLAFLVQFLFHHRRQDSYRDGNFLYLLIPYLRDKYEYIDLKCTHKEDAEFVKSSKTNSKNLAVVSLKSSLNHEINPKSQRYSCAA